MPLSSPCPPGGRPDCSPLAPLDFSQGWFHARSRALGSLRERSQERTLWRAAYSRGLRIPLRAQRRRPMLRASRTRSRPPDCPPVQVTRNPRIRPTVPLTLRLGHASRRRHTRFDPRMSPPQRHQGATITFFRSLKSVGCLDAGFLLCPTCATFSEGGGAT